MRGTSAPISSEKISTPALPQVPAMPATVATSLRLKRSDAIVMTVTDNVWCAKPARLSSAIATYGIVDEADERHAGHHERADGEGAARAR